MPVATFQTFLQEARSVEQSFQAPSSVLDKSDAIADTVISWAAPHGWKKHIRRGKDVLIQEQSKMIEIRNAQIVQNLVERQAGVLVDLFCYDRSKLKQVPSEKLITRLRATLRRKTANAQIRALVETLQTYQDTELYTDKQHIPAPRKQKSLYAFLSYSRRDHAMVHEISRFLDQYGINHFIDEKSIQAGDPISLQVSQALDQCTHFLLFWSQNSAKSEYVASEWSVGYMQEIQSKKKFIVIVLDGAPALPALLSEKKFIQIHNGMFGRALSELMNAFAY